MRKELIVSASNHEIKIAVVEDDQLVEVYFEREKEYSLAGSIYKGRVMRVLPGMQSAFVDIGLERDAFLYVTDFAEGVEEYDKLVSTVERKAAVLEEIPETQPAGGSTALTAVSVSNDTPPPPEPEAAAAEQVAAKPPEVIPQREASAAREPEKRQEGRDHGHRMSRRPRRRRDHRKELPESKYARPSQPESQAPSQPLIILPGESLAKYKGRVAETSSPQEAAPDSGLETVTPVEGPPTQNAGLAQEWETVSEPWRDSREPAAAGTPGGAIPVSESERMEAAAVLVEPALVDAEQPEPLALPMTNEQPPAELLLPVQSVEPPAALPEPEETKLPETAVFETPSEGPRSEQLPAAAEKATAEAAETQPEPTAAETLAAEAEELLDDASTNDSEEEMAAESEGLRVESEGAELRHEAASPASQQATVREGSRNPRFQRRARWLARRQQDTATRQSSPPREREIPRPMIADLLKERQEIIVQIAKEPIGAKGARITSHVALPGRYLVYMPTLEHTGVSRKIASDEERQRLKRIILEHTRNLSGGFIVRTAGEGRSEEDIRKDIAYLANLWAEIKAKSEKTKAPALLHHDLDLVLRTLRDQLSEEFTTVWVDNEQEYEKILDLVSKFQPALLSRIKLYTKKVPLFEELGIQEEINNALKPKIWLKSGGYIVINQTEALVAVDINTGKFVGKSNRLEDTIVKTNVDAIQEIVRQIRLRDLGGIIVIDFIDMDERRNRQKVMSALEEALKADRSPSKILSFNEFGLVAITRKRVRQSLERTLCQPCPDCSGSGYVKSVTSICLEIFAEARKLASQWGDKQVTLRVHPEVAQNLKARECTILQEIEQISGKAVIVRTDPTLHIEGFDFN